MVKQDNDLFVLSERKEVFQCNILKVYEQTAHTPDRQHQTSVYTLGCSNWVNVVPVTAAGQIVLIEQHRFGTDTMTLETPGGAVDLSEKDVTMAALRELEEETGMTSQRILSMPGFGPNPAIQGNRISYFVAFDVQPLAEKPDHHDPFERIKIHLVDIDEAVYMARTGRITHALAALAILLAEPLLKTKFN